MLQGTGELQQLLSGMSYSILRMIAAKRTQETGLIIILVHVGCKNRWDIEVFHKTVKQSYGFEDYQVIKAQARDAYFELAFLSDMLLHLKQLGMIRKHVAGAYVPRDVPTEKVGSEDLVLSALAAQRKGTIKEFVQMCGFDEKRFEFFV